MFAAACWGIFWFRFFLIRHRNNALKSPIGKRKSAAPGFFYLVIMLYQWHDMMLTRVGNAVGMSGMIFWRVAPLRPY